MKIRETTAHDVETVYNIHLQAFGPQEGPEVADLTQALLHDKTARPLLSLMAEAENRPAGHILFTHAWLKPKAKKITIQILAPLGIIPEYQSQGVGGQLIKEGLSILQQRGVDLVFVLGHPGYYPRHGFTPAGVKGFRAPYPIPERNADAWMIQQLHPGMDAAVSGTVQCCKALDQPEHWRE